MHCVNCSCCVWHCPPAAGAGAPSCLWTTSVWRGPVTASTARLATLIPTPVAMPDAIDPISPDIMPPPPAAGAAIGGAAAGATAGGGAAAGAAAGGGVRAGEEAEVLAPLLRGMTEVVCKY